MVALVMLLQAGLGQAPAQAASTVTVTYNVALGVTPGPLVGSHLCGPDDHLAAETVCPILRARAYPDGFRIGLVGLRSPQGDIHQAATLLVQDDGFQSSYVLACVPTSGAQADAPTCQDDASRVAGCTSVYVEEPADSGEGGFGGTTRPLAGYVATVWLDPVALNGCFATSGVGTVVYH